MAVSLIVESCIWYAVCLLMVVARFASQKILRGSYLKIQSHDVLALVALATYTAFVIVLNLVSHYDSNLIDPSAIPLLTKQEISRRVLGSKLVLVTEQMQILTIWLVKACLLLMYKDLMQVTRPLIAKTATKTFHSSSKLQKLCLKLVAGYVAFGFVLMEILYFAVWCRPFNQYWAVPTHNSQCSAATNHLITNAVFNITSDVFIIIIPMPILLHVRLPYKKKALLCGVFAMGLFTIGCAIANKYYSFHDPFGSQWTYWYLRESSTALIVVNMPYLWTIVRFTFKMSPFFSSQYSKNYAPTSTSRQASYGHNVKFVSHSIMITRGPRATQDATNFTILESQEDLTDTNNVPLRIYKVQEVHVSSETPTCPPESKDYVEFHT